MSVSSDPTDEVDPGGAAGGWAGNVSTSTDVSDDACLCSLCSSMELASDGGCDSMLETLLQLRMGEVERYAHDAVQRMYQSFIQLEQQGIDLADEAEWNAPHSQEGNGAERVDEVDHSVIATCGVVAELPDAFAWRYSSCMGLSSWEICIYNPMTSTSRADTVGR
jgi:hypothetical protein